MKKAIDPLERVVDAFPTESQYSRNLLGAAYD